MPGLGGLTHPFLACLCRYHPLFTRPAKSIETVGIKSSSVPATPVLAVPPRLLRLLPHHRFHGKTEGCRGPQDCTRPATAKQTARMGLVLPDSEHRHCLLQGSRGRPSVGRPASSLCSDVHLVSGVGPCACLRVLPPGHGAVDRDMLFEKELGDLSGE